MRLRLADVFTGVLGVCALTSATLAVHRYTSSASQDAGPSARPDYISEWRTVAEIPSDTAGNRGQPRPLEPVTIVELSDFQCPFCALAHSRIRRLQAESPHAIRLVYRHRTLVGHPYAMPAAIASECARAQGKFDAFVDIAFDHQEQLGRIPWDTLARQAGVRDLNTFNICERSAEPLARVQADNALAKRIGVTATPGILIRDSLWLGAPSEDELRSRVERTRPRSGQDIPYSNPRNH